MSFVLSQSTCLTDKWTERPWQYRALHTCSRIVKTMSLKLYTHNIVLTYQEVAVKRCGKEGGHTSIY